MATSEAAQLVGQIKYKERLEARTSAAKELAATRHKYKLSEANSRRRNTVKAQTASAGARAAASKEVIATREAAGQQRLAARQAAKAQTQAEQQSQGQRSRVGSAVGGKALDIATPSADSGLIMTTIFLIVGLIVFYKIVTAASQANTLMTKITGFLSFLSQSNTPLFESTTLNIPGSQNGTTGVGIGKITK
jgi:hypothetical protein